MLTDSSAVRAYLTGTYSVPDSAFNAQNAYQAQLPQTGKHQSQAMLSLGIIATLLGLIGFLGNEKKDKD